MKYTLLGMKDSPDIQIFEMKDQDLIYRFDKDSGAWDLLWDIFSKWDKRGDFWEVLIASDDLGDILEYALLAPELQVGICTGLM